MKNLILLIFLILISLHVHGDDDITKWLYDKVEEGSDAHHNMLEAQKILQWLYDSDAADEIDDLIKNGRFFSIRRKDIWDKDIGAEGYTHKAWKSISISEEFLPLGRRLDMEKDPNDFAIALKLALIYIHEYYHLQDYYDGVVVSSEKPVYLKSFAHYDKLMRQFYKRYRWYVDNKHADEELWRQRFRKFLDKYSHELKTYKNDKYGAITRTFRPIFSHDGCVRMQLTLEELGDYYSEYARNLENEKIFDQTVRYLFPITENPPTHCLVAAQKKITIVDDLPVGFDGPRLRQRIFKIDALPVKNYLKLTKIGDTKKANITIHVAELGMFIPGKYPIPLKKLSTVFQWQEVRETYFEKGSNGVYIIISERGENAFPDKLDLRFSRVWSDPDGNRHESYINANEIDPRLQWEFGFYPISRKSIKIDFHKNNVRDLSFHWSPINGIKMNLKQGDFLKFSSPKLTDELRTITLVDKFGKNQIRLYSWDSSKSYRILQDGEYYLLLNRDDGKFFNREFRLDLEFSRNGVISPAKIKLEKMTESDLNGIGLYRPKTTILDFYIEWKKEVQAFGTKSFFPMVVFELDTKKGDRLVFKNLPQVYVPGISYILKEDALGELKDIKTFWSWDSSNEVSIPDNDKYYFAYVMQREFANSYGFDPEVVHFRGGTEGPAKATYRRMDSSELARFNLFPIFHQKMESEIISQDNPKSFDSKDQYFQMYRMKLDNKSTVLFHKGPNNLKNMNFHLTRLDLDSYSAGKEALDEIHRGFSWNKQFQKVLEPGIYYLVIEGLLAEDQEKAEIPWEVFIRSGESDSSSVKIQRLNKSQMMDRRLKLKP